MTATTFIVKGPFVLPLNKPPGGGRRIDKEQVEKFWETVAANDPEIATSRGCYVFAVRNGRGSKPGYVGKTVRKTFSVEAFHSTKLHLYNKFLSLYHKGKPVMFFVLTKNGRGVATHISFLETFLIQNAVVVNPYHLQNIQRSGLGWGIAGVLRGTGGQPTKSAKDLKDLLKLAHPPKSEKRETDGTEAQDRPAALRSVKPTQKTRVQSHPAKSKSSNR
jgi:hypothetical protein